MYIPKDFVLEDPKRIAEVIRRFNFALLVSALPGQAPVATHLPFLYDAGRGPKGTLTAHMARANPHWRDFAALAEAKHEALVIFSGPHGYISPSWYGPGDAVPTWNYVAVHAYGTPHLIEEALVQPMLDDLVSVHEAGSVKPWSLAGNSQDFMARMRRGIRAFEIPLARIEAKAKLSQNRNAVDRSSVIEALRTASDSDSSALADWMVSLAPEG